MQTGEAAATVRPGIAVEKQRPSPLSGAQLPRGRPKGVRNQVTILRDAVLKAFDKAGGVDYLVKLANGTQSDRAAFTGLLAKVLPTQINANVDGGILLELAWLGARQIGASAAQVQAAAPQALDLQRETDGTYRIIDPHTQRAAAGLSPAPTAQEAAGDAEEVGGYGGTD